MNNTDINIYANLFATEYASEAHTSVLNARIIATEFFRRIYLDGHKFNHALDDATHDFMEWLFQRIGW